MTDSKRRNEVTIFNKEEFKRLKDKSKVIFNVISVKHFLRLYRTT